MLGLPRGCHLKTHPLEIVRKSSCQGQWESPSLSSRPEKKKANAVLEWIALAIHLPQIQPVIVFNLQLEPLIKV